MQNELEWWSTFPRGVIRRNRIVAAKQEILGVQYGASDMCSRSSRLSSKEMSPGDWGRGRWSCIELSYRAGPIFECTKFSFILYFSIEKREEL